MVWLHSTCSQRNADTARYMQCSHQESWEYKMKFLQGEVNPGMVFHTIDQCQTVTEGCLKQLLDDYESKLRVLGP